MKKCIFLLFAILLPLSGNAQLKKQIKKIVKEGNTLYLRENGHNFKLDTKTITVKPKSNTQWDAKGGRIVRENKLGFIDIAVPDGEDVTEYAMKLDETGNFDIVEYNGYGELDLVTVNDPIYPSQWHHVKMQSNWAWDYEMGKASVKVAILDSGIDKNHPDIGEGSDGYSNIDATLGWDYVNNTVYVTPTYNHGTFIAGLIGAKTNNAFGVAGVSGGNNQQGVTLIPYTISLDSIIFTSIIDDAIIAATEVGAKVINMSFSIPESSAITDAIEYADSMGVCLVSSSGNASASSIFYPANIPCVLAVGATDQNYYRPSFSNYGDGLDIVAPGVDILGTNLNNRYGISTGTSASAALVSGTIALMLAINPNLEPSEIRNIIKVTGMKINHYTYDSNSWNNEVGYGAIDANACVKRAAMDIVGPTEICDSATYHVSILTDGCYVVWSLSNNFGINLSSLHTDYPQANECTIIREANQFLNSAVLNADVYDSNGNFTRRIQKPIRMRSEAQYALEYTYSGTPMILPAYVSETFSARVPKTAVVKMCSTDFQTMTITPYGNITYFVHNQDSVKLSCNGYGYLHCVDESGCPEFDLEFIGLRPTQNPQFEPIVNSIAGGIKVGLSPITNDSAATDDNQTVLAENDVEWVLSIFRYRDGKQMYSQTIRDVSCTVNTKGWETGLYIVNVVIDGETYTKMVKI